MDESLIIKDPFINEEVGKELRYAERDSIFFYQRDFKALRHSF